MIPQITKNKIIKDYLRNSARQIIENNLVFKLSKVGSIKIVKIKPTNLPIDWKLTKKHGKVIRHLNLATDGYVFKYLWVKNRFCKNNNKYIFKPVDGKRHAKAGEFQQSIQDYGTYGLAKWIKNTPHYDAEIY